MFPVLLCDRNAHCNKLNHYLGAFLVNGTIKIHFYICASLSFESHGTCFCIFCWPVFEAICQPPYSRVPLIKTLGRKLLLSVSAREHLLLLAMGLDTEPLASLTPLVAWAARKLGQEWWWW